MEKDNNTKELTLQEIEMQKRESIVDLKSQMRPINDNINMQMMLVFGDEKRSMTGLIQKIREYSENEVYNYPPFNNFIPRLLDNIKSLIMSFQRMRTTYHGEMVGGDMKKGFVDVMTNLFDNLLERCKELEEKVKDLENECHKEKIIELEKEVAELKKSNEESSVPYHYRKMIKEYMAKKGLDPKKAEEDYKKGDVHFKTNFARMISGPAFKDFLNKEGIRFQ